MLLFLPKEITSETEDLCEKPEEEVKETLCAPGGESSLKPKSEVRGPWLWRGVLRASSLLCTRPGCLALLCSACPMPSASESCSAHRTQTLEGPQVGQEVDGPGPLHPWLGIRNLFIASTWFVVQVLWRCSEVLGLWGRQPHP